MSSNPAKPERRLRTRLIRQSTLTSALVMLAAACVAGALAYTHLTRQMTRVLDRISRDLVAEYEETKDDASRATFIRHMEADAAEHDTSRFFVLLLDESGKILHATDRKSVV